MKIATWNLQRLDKRKNDVILSEIHKINPDIIVLTETNSLIQLDGYNCVPTHAIPDFFEGIKYKKGENRSSIWTKYQVTHQYKTVDGYTSVCSGIETPFGSLIVYGTIIGVRANQQPRFDNELYGQIEDFKRLTSLGNLCIAGDFNVIFTSSSSAYPSHKAINALTDTFNELKLTNTTAKLVDNVDHIVLSSSLCADKKIEIETWNADKKLSDHIGVSVILTN